MINIIDDMLNLHSEEEIIEHLYSGMSSITKILDDAIDKQNLMEIGAITPLITQYTAILKGLKKKNDLRKSKQM